MNTTEPTTAAERFAEDLAELIGSVRPEGIDETIDEFRGMLVALEPLALRADDAMWASRVATRDLTHAIGSRFPKVEGSELDSLDEVLDAMFHRAELYDALHDLASLIDPEQMCRRRMEAHLGDEPSVPAEKGGE